MSVSIVVPSHNKFDLTKECLNRILTHTPKDYNYEIIMVDNGSTDGTAEYLMGLSHKIPNLKIILNGTNRMWATASNQGLDFSAKDTVVFSQNDVFFEGDVLGSVAQAFKDHPDAGSIGPAGADISLTGNHVVHSLTKQPGPVDYLGTMIAINRKLMLENNLKWDEGYQFFYEDTDMAMQIRNIGKECVIVPLPLRHLKSRTFIPVHGRKETERIRRESEKRFIEKWKDII